METPTKIRPSERGSVNHEARAETVFQRHAVLVRFAESTSGQRGDAVVG